ncbi:aldo/keto reductase [Mycetocola zhadangensis]|uniref:aldo/keto reductase n=1 Tax=Mycetocola zhadangensis TaxID=1164595 RepID=UPI003A4E3DFD
MNKRQLPGTSVELTTLGFGTTPIANMYTAIDDATAHAAVDRAWDAGIRYFDTAPLYGLGLGERRLGAALRDRPREKVVVSSKVGRIIVPNERPTERTDDIYVVPGNMRAQRDYSRDGVLRSIDDTLHRTRLDRLDIVYVHDPDDYWRQASEKALPTLAELRDQGVIRAIGAGMNQTAMLERFLRETAADVVMLAGRYTLLEQRALDDVLPAAAETRKSVIAVGVLNSGILSTPHPAGGATYNYAPAPQPLIEKASRIARVCERHGTTLRQAALAFPLGHSAVVNVTVGMQTEDEVTQNVEDAQRNIPADLWDELREAGLIRADAPTPR